MNPTKPMADPGRISYCIQHMNYLEGFLHRKRATLEDTDFLLEELTMNRPNLGMAIINHERMKESEKRRVLDENLFERSSICLVLGDRGGGKTAFQASCLDRCREFNRVPVCYNKPPAFPHWIRSTSDIQAVPEASFVTVDEGLVDFSAYETQKKSAVTFAQVLAITRQRFITVSINAQTSEGLNRNVFRHLNFFIVKMLPFDELNKSRKTRSIDTLRDFLILMQPQTPAESLFVNPRSGLYFTFSFPLVPWWTDRISKSFQTITDRTEAQAFIAEQTLDDVDAKTITKRLNLRGWIGPRCWPSNISDVVSFSESKECQKLQKEIQHQRE